MIPNLNAMWTAEGQANKGAASASRMVFFELYVPTTNTYELGVWMDGHVWGVSV